VVAIVSSDSKVWLQKIRNEINYWPTEKRQYYNREFERRIEGRCQTELLTTVVHFVESVKIIAEMEIIE